MAHPLGRVGALLRSQRAPTDTPTAPLEARPAEARPTPRARQVAQVFSTYPTLPVGAEPFDYTIGSARTVTGGPVIGPGEN